VSAGGRALWLLGYSFRDFCVLVSTFAQVTSISGAFGGIRGVLARRAALQPCCTHHTAPECRSCHQASPVRRMPSAAFFPHFVNIYIHTHALTHTRAPPAPHTTPTWSHRLWVSTCFSGAQCPLQAPACEEACEEACTRAAALAVWLLSAQLGTA
jgi:hypothetical protein